MREATSEDGVVRLYVERGETAVPQILRLLDGAGLEAASISLHRPSLDDVFLRQTGRSLRDVVLLLVQALIMVALSIPFGLTLDPAGIVLSFGVLALLGLAVAPLSYAAALALKSEDAFAPLIQGVTFPLLLLSGILLPMALAPDWLQFLSTINPLTHTVDAVRALFNGDRGSQEIVIGTIVTAVLAVVGVWTASKAFSRANA